MSKHQPELESTSQAAYILTPLYPRPDGQSRKIARVRLFKSASRPPPPLLQRSNTVILPLATVTGFQMDVTPAYNLYWFCYTLKGNGWTYAPLRAYSPELPTWRHHTGTRTPSSRPQPRNSTQHHVGTKRPVRAKQREETIRGRSVGSILHGRHVQ